MKYRLATVGDVPQMVRLYETHLRENPRVYPRVGEQPAADFCNYLQIQMTQNQASWFAIVAEGLDAEGEPAARGAIQCAINRRFLEHPQLYGYVEFLAVAPALRRKGVARKLVQIGYRELLKRGVGIVECSWAPGSTAEAMWVQMGVRPYITMGAWVTPEGEARADLPTIPSGVRVESTAISMPTPAKPGEEPSNGLSESTE